jgi:hypothetical protein
MKKALLTVWVLVLVLPALATARTPSQSDKVNITGVWDIQFDMGGNTANVQATYKQEGEKLTGTQTSPMEGPASPLEGTVTGNDVKYTITFDMGGQQGKITFTGKVEGDTMKGSFDFAGMGETAFTAKKRQ